MQDLERLRYEALTREHWILRTKAAVVRLGVLAVAIYATWRLGLMTLAGGGAGIIVPFVFQALGTLLLFGLHRARFYEKLRARTESRINQFLSAEVLEEGSLSELWLRVGKPPTKAEFDAKRGQWLGLWLAGTFAAVWLICSFVGCMEAMRAFKYDTGTLIVWALAFLVWTTGNFGFFWYHLSRPAQQPSEKPESPAA